MGTKEFSWDRLLASKVCQRIGGLFKKSLPKGVVDQ